MIVLHKNQMYHLDLPFLLFDSLKRTSPDSEVEIEQLTNSTYKELKKAPLKEIEDYSIARNLQALN